MLSPVVLFALLTLLQLELPVVYACHLHTSCGCSDKSRLHAKIIGGQTVRTRTWSWVVSIRLGNRFQCAGSLLTSSWILTAAHCFSFVSNSGVNIIRIDPSSVTIHAGSNNRGDDSQSRRAVNVLTHPQFDPSNFLNDIALIQVSSPFDMADPSLGQICLPSRSTDEYPPVNSSLVAVGWGRLWQSGPESVALQQVILQAIDHRQPTCSSLIYDPTKQLCAGVENSKKDTCQGDSGGPLMVFTTSEQWVIAGMTSYGYGCAIPQYSGVYTRVIAYLDWIDRYINTTNSTMYAYSSSAHTLYDDAELQWLTSHSLSHRVALLFPTVLLMFSLAK